MKIAKNHVSTLGRHPKHQEHSKRQPREEDLPFQAKKEDGPKVGVLIGNSS